MKTLELHLDLSNKKQTMLLENKKPARNLILAEIQGKVSKYDGFSLAFTTQKVAPCFHIEQPSYSPSPPSGLGIELLLVCRPRLLFINAGNDDLSLKH